MSIDVPPAEPGAQQYATVLVKNDSTAPAHFAWTCPEGASAQPPVGLVPPLSETLIGITCAVPPTPGDFTHQISCTINGTSALDPLHVHGVSQVFFFFFLRVTVLRVRVWLPAYFFPRCLQSPAANMLEGSELFFAPVLLHTPTSRPITLRNTTCLQLRYSWTVPESGACSFDVQPRR